MHDRDTKITASFDDDSKAAGGARGGVPDRSPNTCAFAERFIQTLGQEYLARVLGSASLSGKPNVLQTLGFQRGRFDVPLSE